MVSMSLRSVDMQIVIQKTPEIVRNQQQENSRAQMQQQQFAQQLQNKVEQGDRQVNTLQGAYKSQVGDRRKKDRGRKQKREKESRRFKNEGGSSSVIDIKI